MFQTVRKPPIFFLKKVKLVLIDKREPHKMFNKNQGKQKSGG
jgi:hypothetical protein